MNAFTRRVHFLKTAVSDLEVGAITMSSKYVIKNVLKHISGPLNTVIEYGPGEGTLTKIILQHLSPQGKLIAVESNSEFVNILGGINDRRLHIIHGKAQDAVKKLDKYGVDTADAVIASVPFWFLDKKEREGIIKDAYSILAPGGTLIIFNQYQPLMYALLKKIFGVASISFELRNIPPCFIMHAKKDY